MSKKLVVEVMTDEQIKEAEAEQPGTDLQRDVDESPVYLYLISKGTSTREVYRRRLRQVYAVLNNIETCKVPRDRKKTGDTDPIWFYRWDKIDHIALMKLRAALMMKLKPSDASGCLTVVRGVLGKCFDLDLITVDTWKRISERVEGIKVHKSNEGRHIPKDEIKRLIAACEKDPPPFGIRDIAMFGLGFLAGLRISEVAKLRIRDYDPKTRDIRIIESKGKKSRTVRACLDLHPYLVKWIEYRMTVDYRTRDRKTKRLRKSDSLFMLSNAGIGKILKRRLQQAGIKEYTAFHDLRRTAITNWLDSGIPLFDAQRMAGHASADTTAGYYRGDIEETLNKFDGIGFDT